LQKNKEKGLFCKELKRERVKKNSNVNAHPSASRKSHDAHSTDPSFHQRKEKKE